MQVSDNFPGELSKYAVSIVEKLLQPDVKKRYSMDQAIKHPFFKADTGSSAKKKLGRFNSIMLSKVQPRNTRLVSGDQTHDLVHRHH